MTNPARVTRPSQSVRAGSRAGMVPVRATVSLHPGSGRVQGMRGGATSSRPCRSATPGRGDRSPNLPVGLPSAGATFRPSRGFSGGFREVFCSLRGRLCRAARAVPALAGAARPGPFPAGV